MPTIHLEHKSTVPYASTPIGDDPLDRNLVITEEDHQTQTLSLDKIRLGAMLIHCRGYVVLHNALKPELLDQLKKEFRVIYDDCVATAAGAEETSFGPSNDSKTIFWVRKGRFRVFPRLEGAFATRAVVANPFAAPMLAQILGAGMYIKYAASDTCIRGSILQAPHRDLDFYDGQRSSALTINIPLVECGLHNGPLEVWPGGSHFWNSKQFYAFGVIPNVQDGSNPPVEAFMSHLPTKKVIVGPGDVLIRDPGMWHRGTPNPTDEPRTMLTTTFVRRSAWHDYGDPLANVNRKIYKTLDPDTKKLFAYCFDPTNPNYWRLRHQRTIEALKKRRYLGAPFRIGGRMIEGYLDKRKREE